MALREQQNRALIKQADTILHDMSAFVARARKAQDTAQSSAEVRLWTGLERAMILGLERAQKAVEQFEEDTRYDV